LRTNALNNSDPTMEVNALVIQDVRGARDKKQNGMGITSGPAYTVDGTSRHGVAFEPRYFTRAVGPPPSEVSSTLKADSGRSPKSDASPLAVQATTVRRLTPTETERLQGFPDGFSCLCAVRPDCPDRRIPPWLDPRTFTLGGCGHSACGCKCPDSPRYKAMGNAVAVPVVRWIVDRLTGHMKEGS
jgi:DNA (cytosine-5)-methyltransferase 1